MDPASGTKARRVAALVVVILGAWCVAQASRQTLVQGLYHRARYRVSDPDERAQLVERVFRLDPTHHWLCRWWAANRYRAALRAPSGAPRAVRLEEAAVWADRGLALDPYSRTLRLIRVRGLAARSLPAAIREWREYVRWHFWHPPNHAVLADLYLRAGNWPAARRALVHAAGAPDYPALQKRLRQAMSGDPRR